MRKRQIIFGLSLPIGEVLVAKDSGEGSDERDIQWMPPGLHTINAGKRDDKTGAIVPIKATVLVNEQTAQTVQKALEAHLAAGKKPYLDFNHNDEEASAHVLSFTWGGEDPVKGGVRAKIRLTGPGKEAVCGRAYGSFSPSFDAEDHKDGKMTVSGVQLNMGGFVNRPAFEAIADITAAAANISPMDYKKQLLTLLGLPETATDEEVTKAIGTKLEAEAKCKDDAKDMPGMKAKLQALETEVAKLHGERADAAIKSAISARILPAKDTALHAKWKALIVKDPANEDLLLSKASVEAANPALFSSVIQARKSAPDAATADTAEKRDALVSQYQAKGMKFDAAWRAARIEKPELFNN